MEKRSVEVKMMLKRRCDRKCVWESKKKMWKEEKWKEEM